MRTRVIAGVLLAAVGVLATAGPAYAPEPQQPEKISVDTVIWNIPSQSFEIDVSARFGTAIAAESGSWTLTGVLKHELGAIGTVEEPVRIQGKGAPTGPPGEESWVAINTLVVPWDRDGGRVSGPIDLEVTVEVRNSAGELVHDNVLRLKGFNVDFG